MIVCDFIDKNVENFIKKEKSKRIILTFFKDLFNNFKGNEVLFIDDILNNEIILKTFPYISITLLIGILISRYYHLYVLSNNLIEIILYVRILVLLYCGIVFLKGCKLSKERI